MGKLLSIFIMGFGSWIWVLDLDLDLGLESHHNFQHIIYLI